jgi:hypothetical protein
LDELYETAEELPDVSRHEVHAHNEETDEWSQIPYRDSLWTDDGRATGIVSSSEDFYNVIQYGDILDAVGTQIERYQDSMDIDVGGRVSLSPTAHKMSAKLDFDGDTTVYADEDDPVQLGLKVRSGHSGLHGLKYDVGAERQICSNGMMAFISDMHFEQTHNDPFQPQLAYQAVDSVMESPDEVERRIQEAQEYEFLNQDEALLVLLDLGIDDYLETPVPDLLNALHDEVDGDQPTLWETYNAATNALTHYSEDIPEYELDRGYERAAQLLETGYSDLPNPEKMGSDVVESRASQLIESEGEEYWDGEHETVRELMEEREITA